MALQGFKTLVLVVTAVLALFIVSPVLQQLVVMPQTQLSEIWLLGPKNNSTYPSNVTSGQNIRLYLDVSNHLGSSALYEAKVKFRNSGQSAPDSFTQANSNQSALSSFTFSVADESTYELPIDISFKYTVNEEATRQLVMDSVTINGEVIKVNSTTIVYDSDRGGFFGNLFFELYIYDNTANIYVYHQRYVSVWLQMLP